MDDTPTTHCSDTCDSDCADLDQVCTGKSTLTVDVDTVEFKKVLEQFENVADAFRNMVAAMIPAIQQFAQALKAIDDEYGDVLREAAQWRPIIPDGGGEPTQVEHKPSGQLVPIGQARSAIEQELRKRAGAAVLGGCVDRDDCPHPAPCKGGTDCCRNQGDTTDG